MELSNKHKVLLDIILSYFKDKKEEFSKNEAKMWLDIIFENVQNFKLFKQLYNNISKGIDYSTNDYPLKYTKEDDNDCLCCKEEKYTFDKEKILELLRVVLSVLSNVLPVGSVIKLNEEYCKDMPEQLKEVLVNQDVKIVIQKRFVKSVDDSKYAEYAGCVYPMGLDSNDKKMFIFTNKDIEEIVFKGYQNQEEDMYVALMKKSLVIDKELTSLSY